MGTVPLFNGSVPFFICRVNGPLRFSGTYSVFGMNGYGLLTKRGIASFREGCQVNGNRSFGLVFSVLLVTDMSVSSVIP